MKVTRLSSRDEVRPYNAIFEAYGELLHNVFRERQDVEFAAPWDKFDVDTYVEMPEAQKEITNYAKSGATDIGLVVGNTGIGKSSIIRYLTNVVWKKETCLVLPRDFKTGSENESLGDEYYHFTREQQHAVADKIAIQRLKEMIKKCLAGDNPITGANDHLRFYRFLKTYYPEMLSDSDLFGFSDASHEIHQLLRDSGYECIIRLFLFYLQDKGFYHVKIVLDNLDDKDTMLIACLAEQMAHLSAAVSHFSEIERRKDATVLPRWLSPFIACRPVTAAHLHEEDWRGSKWFGMEEIQVNEPCSLHDLVIKRFTKEVSNNIKEKLCFEIAGKSWTVDDRNKLFLKICKTFNESGQTKQIVQLCNFNMADAMTAMLQAVRNRHFMRDGQILGSFFPEKADQLTDSIRSFGTSAFQRGPFTNTTVLRALAYGNQGAVDVPVYPIARTRVPNLLDSKDARFGESTFKPRILSAFLREIVGAENEQPRLSVGELCEFGSQWFNRTVEQSARIIDELYREGLLANTRIDTKPSYVGVMCPLTITPRAICLWSQLAKDSILLQCFRDDVDLVPTLTWKALTHRAQDRPTFGFSISETFRELFWLLIQFWNGEKSELDRIKAANEYDEFSRRFGERPISLLLIEGLKKSCQGFFSKFSDMDTEAYSSHLCSLEEEVLAY